MAHHLQQAGATPELRRQDRTLFVWDVWSRHPLHELEGHTNSLTAVAVTPDGAQAVSASYDATVRVWDLARGTSLASFTADTPMTSCAAAGRRGVVAGAADGRVHVLRLEGEAP
jgi:WD40 repeat protein